MQQKNFRLAKFQVVQRKSRGSHLFVSCRSVYERDQIESHDQCPS